MNKLLSMNENLETVKKQYGCEFCGRTFVRESTVLKHICEYKHRYLARDKQGNRIGYQCFLDFNKKHTASKKPKQYEEFIKSPYYIAFVKFGNYCVGINCLNVNRYIDWLLKNQIKIDNWCSDQTYSKFLCDHLRNEDPLDAIARSIETTIDLSKDANIQHNDIFKYGNVNKICYEITKGKISPWILYQSVSGTQFLDKLNPDHVRMIVDYINPELWAIKFKKDVEKVNEIKQLLKQAHY